MNLTLISALDSGYEYPTSNGDIFDDFIDPDNAMTSSGYAYVDISGYSYQDYSDFDYDIQSGLKIRGIEVFFGGTTWGSGMGDSVSFYISGDGGTTYSNPKSYDYDDWGSGSGEYTLGNSSNLWGESWTPDNFESGNFTIKVRLNLFSGKMSLNSLQAKIYYYSPVSTTDSPVDNYTKVEAGNVNFSCSATDDFNELSNMTFYLWNSSSVVNTSLSHISGVSNYSNYSYNFDSFGEYTWNCLVIDNDSNAVWGINKTVNLDFYKMNVSNLNSTNPLQVSAGDNISILFDFYKNNVLINNAVTIYDIFFGNNKSPVVSSLLPLDNSDNTCSNTWDEDCAGGSDNTFDSCESNLFYSNGFWVSEAYVNASVVEVGDSIKITCEYDCYAVSLYNDLAISYYNGTWNQVWSQDEICTDGNYSVDIIVSGSVDTQYARCSIGYHNYNPSGTCFVTNYADNDDVEFQLTHEIDEFKYINGTGWMVNVTAPSGLIDLQDLFINSSYNSEVRNYTGENFIDYSGGSPSSTCNPTSPLTSNYIFNSSENCEQNQELDCDGYDISFIGDGTITLSNKVYNWGKFVVWSGSQVTNFWRLFE